MDSIIEGIKEYAAACPLLAGIEGSINRLEDDPDNYGIYPSGDTVVATYINGSEERLYTFTIEVRKMTDNNISRLEGSSFIEKLQRYFNTAALPTLPDNCTAEELTAENGILPDPDKSNKSSTFIVQCSLKYTTNYQEE